MRRAAVTLLAMLALPALAAEYPRPQSPRAKIQAKDLDFTEQAFLHAVTFGQHDDLRWFVQAGMDLNKASDEYGSHAIHIAANHPRTDTAHLLLALGADPNLRNRYQMTALHFAVINHATDLLQALIRKKADVNAANDRGQTGLHLAAERGHVDTLGMLLKAGAAVDATDADGRTPLLVAIESKRHEMIRPLIEAGANLNHTGARERVKDLTPLIKAIRLHDGESIDTLIKAGADVNSATHAGFTPLMITVLEQDPAIMAQLLARGARPDDKGGRREGPLQMCFAARRYDLCELLIRAGAQLDVRTPEGLRLLYNAVGERDIARLDFLLAHGASPNQGERLQERPLSMAVMNGDAEIARLLIRRGAEVNWRDPGTGHTAVFLPALDPWATVETLAVLVEANANLNVVDVSGKTPLMTAATTGATAIVETLLKGGARVNDRDAQGLTALMMAAAAGRVQNVAALLKAGADRQLTIEIREAMGPVAKRTAHDIARERGNRHAAQLLAPAGGKISK